MRCPERPIVISRSPKNPLEANALRQLIATAIARCVAIAKVVMGGRRYGRTVGTTLAPALSADAAVTIVVPGSWTPVPSPKSIK
jgi:hypothetical protein